MSENKSIFKRYEGFIVIFGGFLLNLSIGNLYSYNNMSLYLVTYMQNYSKSGQAVTEGNAVWIFGMGIFGMGSSITLGDILMKKIGPSMTVLLAGWLMSVTVLLMSYTLNTYLAVVVLTYGFINGVGTGIVYGVVISVGCNWFPNRKGAAAGFVVAGFGLSAFLFDIIQSLFIIRGDIQSDLQYVPTSYVMLGCIFMGLQFVGAMLIKNPSEEDQESISTKFESDLFGIKEDRETVVNIRPHNLIVELDFWILWITYSLLSACFALIISLHKVYGKHLKITDNNGTYILTMASSVGSLCNALGRVFWGLIIDRFRYKVVMLTLTLCLAVLLATFYLPVWIFKIESNSTNNRAVESMYFIWIMLLYFIPSGMFAIFPYTCSKLFGQINFVFNYGMLFTAYSIGGLITSCITTYIWYDEKNQSSKLYMWSFISGSVMAVLAALMTLFYRGRSLIRGYT